MPYGCIAEQIVHTWGLGSILVRYTILFSLFYELNLNCGWHCTFFFWTHLKQSWSVDYLLGYLSLQFMPFKVRNENFFLFLIIFGSFLAVVENSWIKFALVGTWIWNVFVRVECLSHFIIDISYFCDCILVNPLNVCVFVKISVWLLVISSFLWNTDMILG